MKMITGNEPAMPFTAATENELLSGHITGLTIRQHFAAMAMPTILAYGMKHEISKIFETAAKDAVAAADALIAELNNPLTP